MNKKTIGIIASGDEILSGRLVDTNSPWISNYFLQYGYQVKLIASAGDNIENLISLIEYSTKVLKNDVTILTGGLGPTIDDKTRYAISKILNKKLIFNFSANQLYHKLMMDRGVKPGKVSDVKNIQCMLPETTICIPNYFGTACGIKAIINEKVLFALPGVPSEMKKMVEVLVQDNPKDFDIFGDQIYTELITLTNISESRLGEFIGKYMDGEIVTVGITAKLGYIHVSFSSKDHKSLLICKDEVISLVQDYTLDVKGRKPAEKLLELCREKGINMGSVESCTGGLVSSAMVELNGASEVFLAGATTYSNESKMTLAKVSENNLKDKGAVSEEVAEEMARGFAEKNKLELCLSTTGVAGPTGGTLEKPVGLVCMSVYYKGNSYNYSKVFNGDRTEVRKRATSHVLCQAISVVDSNSK
ncbi:MAG: hypothetical protein COA79_10270 [Planctomycetota bacterium]|nr:MAG: hypothetical protein COA79_10270 [Planctomycetota bacterium]